MKSHGHTSWKRNVDKRISSEWTSWKSMRERCSDPQKKGHYGLPIDPAWDSFEVFLQDMGLKPTPTHTIDRIDGSKGYYPWNCRWATKAEQGSNRRDNLFQGYSVAKVARELGIEKVHAFRRRVELGQPWDHLVPDENRAMIGKFAAVMRVPLSIEPEPTRNFDGQQAA